MQEAGRMASDPARMPGKFLRPDIRINLSEVNNVAKYKAVVTSEMSEEYLAHLQQLCDVTLSGWLEKDGWVLSEDEAAVIFHDAEIVVVGYDPVSKKVLDACPNIRLIACTRGNPVNVDCSEASKRGIPVIFTPGRNANSVAEFLLGELIGLIRWIPLSYHQIRNGHYLGEPTEDIYRVPPRDDIVWGLSMDQDDNPFKTYQGYELFHRTFGMIGYGAVGRRLAKFLKAMDMRIVIYDPYLPPAAAEADGVEMLPLDDLLRVSDFVSLHCKVTEETKGMFGAREFSLMKPTAVFINTARGVIVQQKALIDALEQKQISGAVLDVYWEEPLPANHPLLQMDNVVMTPHIAGSSSDVITHHSIMIVEDVERFIKGEPLQYVFNKEVLK